MSSSQVTAGEVGDLVRRQVLGSPHVDRSMAQASEFARPVQELVTQFCWGSVWSRPGLDLKTRSMLNLAMLTALNRRHELELHVRGALNNGVTPAQIQEVLLQTAVYCGMPAALESFRAAESVLVAAGYELHRRPDQQADENGAPA